MKQQTIWTVLALFGLSGCGSGDRSGGGAAANAGEAGTKSVNVYNWSDYIAEDTIPGFEKASGIKVVYDVFDSNELLEAKLLAGGSGYDVVAPSLSFLGRQIQAGAFQPLDRSKLPNWNQLDAQMMQRIARQDPGNKYGVPYLWGTTGIGYNIDKIKAAFGSTEVVQSWDLVFKPENLARLKDCGVTFLDTAAEIVPTTLHYLGEDPNSTDPAVIAKAGQALKRIRPYIQNFHSSQYIDALAKGSTCLVVGWSGDILQARNRADEAGNGVHIGYSIPREGALQFFDMLAIPADAKNVDAAHQFINYLLTPGVAAANSSFVNYPNAVPASLPLIAASVREDETVYPPAPIAARLFGLAVMPPQVDRQYTRLWTELKTGH